MIHSIKILLDKLLIKKIIDPITGCWLYTGYINEDGYGIIKFYDKHWFVHRLSAVLFLGLRLDDKILHSCHKCDNRHCFNWNHLFIANSFIHTQYDKAKRNGLELPDPYKIVSEESDYLIF